jgi:putative acetyltransferase
MPITIRSGLTDDPRVVALVMHHQKTALEQTEAGCGHALDMSGLTRPGITLYSAWEGETLLGTAALKRLDQTHGEVKTMHTVAEARRRGVGAMLVQHVMAEARSMGLTRLSLETGSWPYFQPAIALYRAQGFTECGPFGDYHPSEHSVYMTRAV